jgi:radical SAM superfamily enzyme YgiQ (UPF0313 family)
MRYPYPVHPIGLDYVAGALAPAHEVRVLDLCPLEESEVAHALDAAVGEFTPGAVGLSIRNVDTLDAPETQSFLQDARAVVDRLRATSGASVVLGGAGFTLFPGEMLQALGADYGVVGEGERARALFDALAAGAVPDGLPGVVRRGQPAPAPRPLAPGQHGARASPAGNPALGWYLARGGILGLQTQRGCALRCLYCTYPTIEGGEVRAFDPAAVAAEGRMLEELGARFLFLTDSVFNSTPAHALTLAAAFRRAGLRVPWGAYFAPSTPPPGFYAAMREAGCTHVEFGTESMCDAMLPRLHKPFGKADVLRAHAAARAAGIHVAHFMAMGGPGETAATVAETLDGCEALGGATLFFFCGMRIYPGTGLERVARAAGQLAPGQSLLEPVYYRPPELSLDALAMQVRERAEGHPGWMVGSGAAQAGAAVERLHARGYAGPLWELLASP